MRGRPRSLTTQRNPPPNGVRPDPREGIEPPRPVQGGPRTNRDAEKNLPQDWGGGGTLFRKTLHTATLHGSGPCPSGGTPALDVDLSRIQNHTPAPGSRPFAGLRAVRSWRSEAEAVQAHERALRASVVRAARRVATRAVARPRARQARARAVRSRGSSRAGSSSGDSASGSTGGSADGAPGSPRTGLVPARSAALGGEVLA